MKIAGGVLFCAALIFGAFHLFVGSSYFRIREVEISGPFRQSQAREIAALAHIPAGKNLFFINLYEVGRQISRHPWVRAVSVRREFPDTLSIHVDEFLPVAILETSTDLYYLSEDGTLFKRLETADSRAFPKIYGFETGKLEKFPFYYGPQVKAALKFLTRFKTLPGNEEFTVASLRHDDAEGYGTTVCRGESCGTVFFGKDDDEKMAAWIRFARTLNEKDEKKWFKAVDLHVSGKVFAKGE